MPVIITHANGAKHSAGWGLLDAVGYGMAAGFHDVCHAVKCTYLYIA
jgi:hypothetical protein